MSFDISVSNLLDFIKASAKEKKTPKQKQRMIHPDIDKSASLCSRAFHYLRPGGRSAPEAPCSCTSHVTPWKAKAWENGGPPPHSRLRPRVLSVWPQASLREKQRGPNLCWWFKGHVRCFRCSSNERPPPSVQLCRRVIARSGYSETLQKEISTSL